MPMNAHLLVGEGRVLLWLLYAATLAHSLWIVGTVHPSHLPSRGHRSMSLVVLHVATSIWSVDRIALPWSEAGHRGIECSLSLRHEELMEHLHLVLRNEDGCINTQGLIHGTVMFN